MRQPPPALRLVGAVILAGALGCGAPPTPAPAPAPAATAWETTLAQARGHMEAGRYAEADSLLGAFAERHVGSPAAAEALFWRAVVRVDPANGAATPRTALAALDAYLAGGSALPRYQEALVLRRVASVLDGVRRPPAPVTPDTVIAPPVENERLRVTQDSLRQVKLELERALADLERIRRRLQPPPGRSP